MGKNNEEVFLCIQTKLLTVGTVAAILISLLQSRNSMRKKAFPMNLVVVRNAGQQEKRNQEATAEAVAMADQNARCTRRFVLPVEKIQQCLSNPVAINRFIAEIASNHNPGITGKLKMNFPGFHYESRGFLFYMAN